MRILIDGLPPNSRYSRALYGDVADWAADPSLKILAHIWEILEVANWQRGNEGRKTPKGKPQEYPRPGIVRHRNLKARFDAFKARHADRLVGRVGR